ncbi:MAG: PilZ domain-containing protein [Pseudomonadota bacterium]
MNQTASKAICEQPDSPSFVEQRGSRRVRVLKSGHAAINSGFTSFRVLIRDLSETGAKLVSEDEHNLPSRFNLHIELDGFQVDCECVWREGHTYGVRFTGKKQSTRVMRNQVVQPTLAPDENEQGADLAEVVDAEAEREQESAAENIIPVDTRIPIKNLRSNSVFGRRR